MSSGRGPVNRGKMSDTHRVSGSFGLPGKGGFPWGWLGSILAVGFLLARPSGAELPEKEPEFRFGLREAEHLLNRAGFGGKPEEIQALANLGLRGAVQALLRGRFSPDPESKRSRAPERVSPTWQGYKPEPARLKALPEKERRKLITQFKKQDTAQHVRFRGWWIEEMIGTRDVLGEKMALFWHGYFTSSQRDVRDSYQMIRQIQLYRDAGRSNFRTLIHRVAKDPAMLAYLDNDQNRKRKPNENFARELMELFTLGPGHYTEEDIKQAARAFTGWTSRNNKFFLDQRVHDRGPKVVLGNRGRFGGEDVIDLLLAEEAAPRFLATRLLGTFVGPNVPDSMVVRYGELLRKHQWALKPVLGTLFTDPEFYAPEIVGSKILSPVEYLVGICRRYGEHPPGAFLASAASLLGQSLLNPPNVKGWEGGEAWITTSTFLQRGNLAAHLIEGFDPERIHDDLRGSPSAEEDPLEAMEKKSGALPRGKGSSRSGLGGKRLPSSVRLRWAPKERVRWLLSEEERSSKEAVVDALCDRFLGVTVTEEARASLLLLFQAPTETRDLKGGQNETSAPGFVLPDEAWLKRLVRLILSLPEAQLG